MFAGPGVSTVSSASQTFAGECTHQVNLGGLAQDRLSFGDRLYTTIGLRIDGNSAFGHNYGFQKYPKIDAAYNLDGYSWLPKSSTAQAAQRHRQGRQGARPVRFLPDPGPGRGFHQYAGPRAGKPGQPQPQARSHHGDRRRFDAGLFHDRLGLSGSIFESYTHDAILPIPLPPSSGLTAPRSRT